MRRNVRVASAVDSSKRIRRHRIMASDLPTGPVMLTFTIDRIKDIKWFKVSDEVKATPRSRSLYGYYVNCFVTVSGKITNIEGKTFDEPCNIKFDMDIRSILLKANLLRDVEIDDRGNIDLSAVERILRDAGLLRMELVSRYGIGDNVLNDAELGLEFEGSFDYIAERQIENTVIGA